MTEWLEQELTRQLEPVPAPEGLWNRIHEQRRPLRTTPHINAGWALAAAALLLMVVTMIGQRAFRTPEFRSADPTAIRAWVKSEAGLDVPFPNQLPDCGKPVSLVGARLFRQRGERIAAITYRIGNDFVSMLVRPGSRSGARHSLPRIESTATVRTISWDMGAETYTVNLTPAMASGQACVLCHADAGAPPQL
jgi:hypothetical protein